jgi:hypothetical protein
MEQSEERRRLIEMISQREHKEKKIDEFEKARIEAIKKHPLYEEAVKFWASPEGKKSIKNALLSKNENADRNL